MVLRCFHSFFQPLLCPCHCSSPGVVLPSCTHTLVPGMLHSMISFPVSGFLTALTKETNVQRTTEHWIIVTVTDRFYVKNFSQNYPECCAVPVRLWRSNQSWTWGTVLSGGCVESGDKISRCACNILGLLHNCAIMARVWSSTEFQFSLGSGWVRAKIWIDVQL